MNEPTREDCLSAAYVDADHVATKLYKVNRGYGRAPGNRAIDNLIGSLKAAIANLEQAKGIKP